MEIVAGILVIYVIYKLLTAPAERARALQESRRYAFDRDIASEIEDACNSLYKPPQEDPNVFISFNVDFTKMTMEESTSVVDPFHEDQDQRQLFRARDGRWYWRSVTSWHEGKEFSIADQATRSSKLVDEPTLAEATRVCVEAFLTEWTRVPKDLAPWLETAYGQCNAFFRAHPGLFPQMTADVYAGQQFDPKQVWSPAALVTDRDFEASRARVLAALRRLRDEYDARGTHERARLLGLLSELDGS